MTEVVVLPYSEHLGSYRTGSLPRFLSHSYISETLGFKPNVRDDPDKVTKSWAFTVNGHRCAIWDYKGTKWSVFDPDGVLNLVFDSCKDDNWN